MALKKSEIIDALFPLTKRSDWWRLIYVAALESVDRGFYGQLDPILFGQVQDYCTIEQVVAAADRVMALGEKARDAAAERIEVAQKTRSAERAFPVVAPAPKVEIVKAARAPRARAHSRCRADGCSAMGVAKYGGYCFECNQDA